MADTIAADPAFRQAIIIAAISSLTSKIDQPPVSKGDLSQVCLNFASIACRIADEVIAIESGQRASSVGRELFDKAAEAHDADGTFPTVSGESTFPMHPGELIWKHLMLPWTVEQFAERIGVTVERAYLILREKVRLTDDECMALGIRFGTSTDHWRRLRDRYTAHFGKRG